MAAQFQSVEQDKKKNKHWTSINDIAIVWIDGSWPMLIPYSTNILDEMELKVTEKSDNPLRKFDFLLFLQCYNQIC